MKSNMTHGLSSSNAGSIAAFADCPRFPTTSSTGRVTLRAVNPLYEHPYRIVKKSRLFDSVVKKTERIMALWNSIEEAVLQAAGSEV